MIETFFERFIFAVFKAFDYTTLEFRLTHVRSVFNGPV